MVMYAAESTEEVERALDFIQSHGITVEMLEEIFPALEPRNGNFKGGTTFKEQFDEIANDIQALQDKLITLAALYLRDTKSVTPIQ